MDYLEIVGVGLGILYLYWEYRASAWLWLASIAMPAIYLEVYYSAGLYADFAISIYYILASIYGLLCWLRGRRHQENNKSESDEPDEGISRMPLKEYALASGVLILIFIGIGILLSRFTDSTVPWADAFTTALSILAMWMLAKKYVEQWLVWILADLGCSLLYLYKGLWFTAVLYFAYAVVAVFGYLRWKKIIDRNV